MSHLHDKSNFHYIIYLNFVFFFWSAAAPYESHVGKFQHESKGLYCSVTQGVKNYELVTAGQDEISVLFIIIYHVVVLI